MQSATRTYLRLSLSTLLILAISSASLFAQLNSPYSRFGIGDVQSGTNIVNRGMANLAAAYADYQSVNMKNPASLSNIQTVTFDVGIEAAFQNLLNQERTQTKKSANLVFNYVALGIPLLKDKKGVNRWGMSLGLKPYSQISYNVYEDRFLPGIDSVQTYYSGTGGTYKAFVGTGIRFANFSAGLTAAYFFGQQDINNRQTWRKDSLYYFDGNFQNRTNYKQLVWEYGAQYRQKLGKTLALRAGINGSWQQSVRFEQDIVTQTYFISATTGIDSIDVVERKSGVGGSLTLPNIFAAGVILEEENKWQIGVEYETGNWQNFDLNGVNQNLSDASILRVGGAYTPSITDNKRYLRRVTYRTGFYTGKDYVVISNMQLPVWGVTAGFGLPVRRYNIYSNQFTTLNLSLEYGSRGGKDNPLQENMFRVGFGFSLSDLWFNKRRYN